MEFTANWNNRHKIFRLKAVAGMLLGFLTVMLMILYLNSLSTDKPKEEEFKPQSFQVVKNVKTPKKPKPVPKKQAKTKAAKVNPLSPALASLGIEMSGINFNSGAFDPNSAMPSADENILGDTSNAVMTGDTVDQIPRALSRAALQYPARAKAKEIEGFVLLSILINEQGKVEEVKVLESDPQGTFEEVAIRNIKKWRFSPAKYQGKPVKTWVNQSITFQLG